jgi:hypothetical protein
MQSKIAFHLREFNDNIFEKRGKDIKSISLEENDIETRQRPQHDPDLANSSHSSNISD